MHLLGMKIRPRKYNHWLSQLLPARLTDDEKDTLMPRLLRKDPSAIERVIEGHMGLIGRIVGQYAWQAPTKIDDIMSVGLLACCEAVNKFANQETKNDNLTAYIAAYVHGLIHNFLVEDQTIKPSRRIEGTHVRCAELNDARHTGIVHQFDTPNDLIEEVGMEDLEKMIAVMALEGYTDREIAAVAQKSAARIGQIRKIVGQKILEVLGNE
jgi:DNA-directed RNA polymerase specialized sigma subunit